MGQLQSSGTPQVRGGGHLPSMNENEAAKRKKERKAAYVKTC